MNKIMIQSPRRMKKIGTCTIRSCSSSCTNSTFHISLSKSTAKSVTFHQSHSPPYLTILPELLTNNQSTLGTGRELGTVGQELYVDWCRQTETEKSSSILSHIIIPQATLTFKSQQQQQQQREYKRVLLKSL
jgi:hypothetical protein